MGYVFSYLFVFILLATVTSTTEQYFEHSENPPLLPFYFGEKSYYYISTFKANVDTAASECRKLNNFNLVSLESEDEISKLMEQIKTKDVIFPFWTSGILPSGDSSSYKWNSTDEKFSFPNFSESNVTRLGMMRRKRSDSNDYCNCTETTSPPETITTTITYPEITTLGTTAIPCTQKPPVCKTPNCTYHLPNCTTQNPTCDVCLPECVVTPPECFATCSNCRIEQERVCRIVGDSKCTVTPGYCDVCHKNASCTTKVEQECTTVRPDCIVLPANCTVPPIQDLCTTTPNTPCTTRQPCATTPGPCHEECITTTPPCYVKPSPCTADNGTITCKPPIEICPKETTTCKQHCQPPTTHCRPIFDCRPTAWVCMTPAIICTTNQTYCPPPVTTCKSPDANLTTPDICCTEPQVTCTEPDVVCEPAKVVCDAPEVSCSSPIAVCQPRYNCSKPIVTCPAATASCEQQPDDCEVSPPDCSGPPLPLPIPSPCDSKCRRRREDSSADIGCVSISTQTDVKWQLESCKKEHYFICESKDQIR